MGQRCSYCKRPHSIASYLELVVDSCMVCEGLLLKEADGAQEEQEESRKAIERDRREAARALMEWEERSQQASALEARLAAREAALREREDSFEAQVRPLPHSKLIYSASWVFRSPSLQPSWTASQPPFRGCAVQSCLSKPFHTLFPPAWLFSTPFIALGFKLLTPAPSPNGPHTGPRSG